MSSTGKRVRYVYERGDELAFAKDTILVARKCQSWRPAGSVLSRVEVIYFLSLAGKSISSSIKTSVLTRAARAYRKRIGKGGSRFPSS